MFLKSDYQDLLPSAPERAEAPYERNGFSGFLALLGRSCGTLLLANLFFLLGCIPIVTIPLSLFAMNRVVHRMVQDQPVPCFQIFKETFQRCWKQSWLAFLLTAFPLVCAGYGMWFYLRSVVSTPLFFLPFLVCSTIFLVALLSSGCLYGLLDSGRGLQESLRLALLVGVAKPQRTVPAALCGYGLPILTILLFPLSGLYLLLLGFSLPCVLKSFFLRNILLAERKD